MDESSVSNWIAMLSLHRGQRRPFDEYRPYLSCERYQVGSFCVTWRLLEDLPDYDKVMVVDRQKRTGGFCASATWLPARLRSRSASDGRRVQALP